jgi:hypothetical protein
MTVRLPAWTKGSDRLRRIKRSAYMLKVADLTAA